MRADRRDILGLLPAVSLMPSLSPLVAARPRRQTAALIVPLTGPSAALGLSMQRAALLAQPVDAKESGLILLDSGGTAPGATLAATKAIRDGASLLLGPLFGAEVRAAVAAAAGRVPVLCFSNDETLRDSGAFLLGVTASQCAAAILGYARRRGVRRIAVLQGTSAWAFQSLAAAERLQGELGIALLPVAAVDATSLRQAGGGELPDALFVSEGGAPFVTAAGALQGSGMQLLGTMQALDIAAMPRGAPGAWIAAPDPAAFATFARTYEERNGAAPGAIAALAYDGATIVNALRASGRIDRAGLLQPQGFPGVTGAVRFREDGSASRPLAILVGEATGYTVIPA